MRTVRRLGSSVHNDHVNKKQKICLPCGEAGVNAGRSQPAYLTSFRREGAKMPL